jgi:hypothetical protein
MNQLIRDFVKRYTELSSSFLKYKKVAAKEIDILNMIIEKKDQN